MVVEYGVLGDECRGGRGVRDDGQGEEWTSGVVAVREILQK